MRDTLLKHSMQALLKNPDEAAPWLLQAVRLLEEYRDAGGTQQSAVQLLESLRYAQDENWEDRVLEVLDIAQGFCRAELRVW